MGKNQQTIDISLKNGSMLSFFERDLDCSQWTMKGHASNLIEAWKKSTSGIYSLDPYNAILLEEIVSVTITTLL